MNKKTMNTLLTVTGVGLGIAGLILILLSVFAEKNTLIWGMLCVALGTLVNAILMLWRKKA